MEDLFVAQKIEEFTDLGKKLIAKKKYDQFWSSIFLIVIEHINVYFPNGVSFAIDHYNEFYKPNSNRAELIDNLLITLCKCNCRNLSHFIHSSFYTKDRHQFIDMHQFLEKLYKLLHRQVNKKKHDLSHVTSIAKARKIQKQLGILLSIEADPEIKLYRHSKQKNFGEVVKAIWDLFKEFSLQLGSIQIDTMECLEFVYERKFLHPYGKESYCFILALLYFMYPQNYQYCVSQDKVIGAELYSLGAYDDPFHKYKLCSILGVTIKKDKKKEVAKKKYYPQVKKKSITMPPDTLEFPGPQVAKNVLVKSSSVKKSKSAYKVIKITQ